MHTLADLHAALHAQPFFHPNIRSAAGHMQLKRASACAICDVKRSCVDRDPPSIFEDRLHTLESAIISGGNPATSDLPLECSWEERMYVFESAIAMGTKLNAHNADAISVMLREPRLMDPTLEESQYSSFDFDAVEVETKARVLGIKLMGKMNPADLEEFEDTLVYEMESDFDEGVRIAAAETLAKLDKKALAKHAGSFIALLKVEKLRTVSLGALQKLGGGELVKHEEEIMVSLEDPGGRQATLVAIAIESPATLAKYARKLVDMGEFVGSSAMWDLMEALKGLDRVALSQNASAIVETLKEMDEAVRLEGLRVMAKLDSATLAEHAERIVNMCNQARVYLEPTEHQPTDTDIEMKEIYITEYEAAICTLKNLDTADLAKYLNVFIDHVMFGLEPRNVAIEVLDRIDKGVLAENKNALTVLLRADSSGRKVALSALCESDAATGELGDYIADSLEDSDPEVREGALCALSRLPPPMLSRYASEIAANLGARTLQDGGGRVRIAAVRALGKLNRTDLLQHVDTLIEHAQLDGEACVRNAAVETLVNIGTDVLAEVLAPLEPERKETIIALVACQEFGSFSHPEYICSDDDIRDALLAFE